VNVEFTDYPLAASGSSLKMAYITRSGKAMKGFPSRLSVCKREANELDKVAAKAAGASLHYDEAQGISHLSAFMRKRTKACSCGCCLRGSFSREMLNFLRNKKLIF